MPEIKFNEPPGLAGSLPQLEILKLLKRRPAYLVPAHSRIYRAAWNSAAVLPLEAKSFYRFGPPPPAGVHGVPIPFWWLYVAERPMTCVFEAGFCGHDARRAGRFFIEPDAVAVGLIATMAFPVDCRLLDLTGQAIIAMGLHDRISDPDHEWCQYFAARLHSAGLFSGKDAYDGILYPSRKNRAEMAIAVTSKFIDLHRKAIRPTLERFEDTPEYQALILDPFCIAKP